MATDKKFSNLETQPLSLSALDDAMKAITRQGSGVKIRCQPEYIILPPPKFVGEVISDLYLKFVAVEGEGGGLEWEMREVEEDGH